MSFHLDGVGEIYYIHPQGNDQSGNGSSVKPWRSLHYATGVVKKQGDVIHIMKGVYVESASCFLAEGVNIEGEGEGTIIKSSDKADWIPIISATSPEGTDGNQHISGLTLDGQKLSSFWAIRVAGRSNVSIFNCTIVDFKDRGVIFDGRIDNKPEPPTVFAKGNSFHDNIVNNCAAYNTENGIYGRGCLNIGGQEGMLIYNNIIVQDKRPDGYNGYPIKYSNDGYLKGIKIYNNIITKIPFKGTFGGDNGWDFSIELWNIMGGMEIYGNTIQGAIDLVNTSRNGYPFGIWFHNNTVSQKMLNDHFESGIVFELSQDGVIVEKNKFEKLSGGIFFNTQEGSLLSDVIIRENIFSDIGKRTGDGNNGSAINLNRGILFGDELHYEVNNLSIADNIISAASGNAPNYGIEITGAAMVNNVWIRNNTIKNFRVSFLIANPAKVVDSIFLENNTLADNGNNNNPLFIIGRPGNYQTVGNLKKRDQLIAVPGYNIREQLIRPFYYEVKEFNFISGLAFITAIISFWCAGRNLIYVYVFGAAAVLFGIIATIEQGYKVYSFFLGCFIPLFAHGWLSWNKIRDRKRNKLPISYSTVREQFFYGGIFLALYAIVYIAFLIFGREADTIIWADSLFISAAFTATLIISRKKFEGWIWWISLTLFGAVLYFEKNYLITSLCLGLILMIEIWNTIHWKKILRFEASMAKSKEK